MTRDAIPAPGEVESPDAASLPESEHTKPGLDPIADLPEEDVTDPEIDPLTDETDPALDPLSAERLLADAERADGSSPDEHLEPPKMELRHEVVPPLVEDEDEAEGEEEEGDTAEIPLRDFDPDALKVVRRLRQHGFEAYFVGGCVRDLLLGRKPKDFDVATSAHPDEVRDIFRNCRLIGRRFRLAHVYFRGGKIVEVSTFRANPTELLLEEEPAGAANGAEGGQSGGTDLLITSDNVFGTAEEDARRRDFTINGLFYDVGEGRVIDYVRGRRDVDERYVRTIGDPETRLREDPVRILRGVRFACKLDLDIESRTYAAMEGAVEDLPRCSAPRLLEETFRLIRGGTSTGSLKLLRALEALKLLLPPVDQFLRDAGPEVEKLFYAHTAAMDARIQKGQALEDAILLAVLLLPLANAAPAPENGGPPATARVVEDLLTEVVRNTRMPRRIAERCRMMLIAQRTLSGQRRRRGSLGSFRRHPLFHEALTVFAISVEATGEHREALERWSTGEAPEPRSDAEGPKRRRRRRRRRGGGRGPGSGPGGGPEAGEGGGGDDSPSLSVID